MTLASAKRLVSPSHISRRALVKGFFAGSVFSYLASQTHVDALEVLSNTGTSKALLVPTMKGPVRCDSLGTTLMHEHVLWFGGPRLEDSGYTPIPDDKREQSVDFAVSLLNAAEGVGIDTLVDLTPHRPIDLYQQIARRTRVKIVPSTGFYRRAKIPKPLAAMEDEKQMYEHMLKEVTEGIEGTKIRAGIIKIAAETSPLSDWEKKVFRAAARAQRATGVPIATHDGAGAREQFDLLVQSGATPRRVIISHVDMGLHGKCTREQLVEELISIARDGGYMEFDTFGQESYTPWRDLIFLWHSIIDAGFASRMFFSMDCNWRWENGRKIFEGADRPDADPDASRRTYAYMMTDAVPKLLKSGFTQQEIHTILVDNPRRFFVQRDPTLESTSAHLPVAIHKRPMTENRSAPFLLLGIFCMLSPARAQHQQGNARIIIDPVQKHQEIQGFGVNYTGPYFRDDQKAMFDMLIDDLGVTMFRVVPYLVYSNWEETNDNDDPRVMNWEYYNDRYSTPIFEATWNGLRYLNSRGIRPMLALMGPVPAWMTDSNPPPPRHKVCQEKVPPSLQGHLSPDMYEEFAEEVVSMVEYARTQAHIDFEYFSPFNETDCYPPEGPRVDPDEAPKVLKAVAQRLKKEGLGDIRLAVADNAIITNDYTDPILQDDELMKQVGVFAFHTYGENSVGPQVERVKSSKYPQVPVWLTEYGDLHDENKTFENQWKNFCLAANRRALTALNQGASAIFFFDAFDDYEECAKRLCYYGLFRSASHVYSAKKSYYATRQLYHFVRPGWRRIAATSEAPALTVSGFQGPSADSLVIVGVKEGGPNRVQIELPRTAAGPASWELYETTRELDCQKVNTLTVEDRHAEIELPAEAVFTLVGRSGKAQIP